MLGIIPVICKKKIIATDSQNTTFTLVSSLINDSATQPRIAKITAKSESGGISLQPNEVKPYIYQRSWNSKITEFLRKLPIIGDFLNVKLNLKSYKKINFSKEVEFELDKKVAKNESIKSEKEIKFAQRKERRDAIYTFISGFTTVAAIATSGIHFFLNLSFVIFIALGLNSLKFLYIFIMQIPKRIITMQNYKKNIEYNKECLKEKNIIIDKARKEITNLNKHSILENLIDDAIVIKEQHNLAIFHKKMLNIKNYCMLNKITDEKINKLISHLEDKGFLLQALRSFERKTFYNKLSIASLSVSGICYGLTTGLFLAGILLGNIYITPTVLILLTIIGIVALYNKYIIKIKHNLEHKSLRNSSIENNQQFYAIISQINKNLDSLPTFNSTNQEKYNYFLKRIDDSKSLFIRLDYIEKIKNLVNEAERKRFLEEILKGINLEQIDNWIVTKTLNDFSENKAKFFKLNDLKEDDLFLLLKNFTLYNAQVSWFAGLDNRSNLNNDPIYTVSKYNLQKKNDEANNVIDNFFNTIYDKTSNGFTGISFRDRMCIELSSKYANRIFRTSRFS